MSLEYHINVTIFFSYVCYAYKFKVPSGSRSPDDYGVVSISTGGAGHGWDDTSPEEDEYVEGADTNTRTSPIK